DNKETLIRKSKESITPFANMMYNCKRNDIFIEELKILYKEINLLSKYDIEKIEIINSMYKSFSLNTGKIYSVLISIQLESECKGHLSRTSKELIL
ncbi:8519_t:CDS:1, partial [Gigaspora margarita]